MIGRIMNQVESPVSPFLPWDLANAHAGVIANCSVVSIDSGEDVSVMAVRVVEVFRGEVAVGDSLSVKFGRWDPVEGGDVFLFLAPTVDDSGTPSDWGLLAATDSRRTTLRVMAGLQPSPRQPDVDRVVALIFDSDVVAHGVACSTSPTTARFQTSEILKGDAKTVYDEFDVERGYDTIEPGGPWEFPMSQRSITLGDGGYLFLKRQGDRFLVMNPVPPWSMSTADVRLALSRWRESRQTPTSE